MKLINTLAIRCVKAGDFGFPTTQWVWKPVVKVYVADIIVEDERRFLAMYALYVHGWPLARTLKRPRDDFSALARKHRRKLVIELLDKFKMFDRQRYGSLIYTS